MAHRVGNGLNLHCYTSSSTNIIAWRGLAEISAEHLSKGRLVYVGGRFHSRSWTGQDGIGRSALEIIADEIQFLTPKPYTAPAAEAA